MIVVVVPWIARVYKIGVDVVFDKFIFGRQVGN